MAFDRWRGALSVLAFLLGVSGPSHAAVSERVHAVLSSPKPAALVVVPQSFLSPETNSSEGKSQTRAEWASTLERWKAAVEGEIDIVVVPAEELADIVLVLDPHPEGECVTVFRRPSGEALSHEGCVVGSETYAAASDWLRGKAVPSKVAPSLQPITLNLYAALPSADVCSGIWRQSLAEGKALVGAVRRQTGYQFTSYTVSQHLKQGTWHVVWATPDNMETGGFFIDTSGAKPRLANVWGGMAEESEFENIERWAMELGKNVPRDLAKCFAWYVVRGRSLDEAESEE